MALKIRHEDAAKTITRALDYIEDELRKSGLGAAGVHKTLMLAEEAIVALVQAAPKDSDVTVKMERRLGGMSVKITAAGEEIDFAGASDFGLALDTQDMDVDAEIAIRRMVLRAFGDRMRYRHQGKRNVVQIMVKKSERAQLVATLIALAAAVVCGFGMRMLLGTDVQAVLDTYVLSAVKTLFMNALKMIVGPVVFFSIASCVAGFGDMREFGKIGGKVVGFYMFTTLIAVAIGLGLGIGVDIGTPGMLGAAGASVAAQAAEISIFDTLMNIVPSNIVKPFADADMLQIIFIAILLGVSAGVVQDYSAPLKTFFDAGNALFLKVTTMITRWMPIVVFCSVCSLVLTTGADTLLSVLGFIAVFTLGLVLMALSYCVLLAVLARLNPFTFLKKAYPTALTAFSLASSSATMPVTMKCCTHDLGISSKIASFSVPLGATINMDGTCVYLAIAALFLANIYGVTISAAALVSMAFSIIVLSVGAPGVPGSGLICLSVLLTQLNVPVEALSIIMGVDALMGMMRTASNVLGDVVGSLVVAKTENMLDMDVFTK